MIGFAAYNFNQIGQAAAEFIVNSDVPYTLYQVENSPNIHSFQSSVFPIKDCYNICYPIIALDYYSNYFVNKFPVDSGLFINDGAIWVIPKTYDQLSELMSKKIFTNSDETFNTIKKVWNNEPKKIASASGILKAFG